MKELGVTNHKDINQNCLMKMHINVRPTHVTLIVQTQEGLKNLFKIVSASLVKYYYRTPRIPRSLLNEYREGILVGTACDEGELFTAVMQRPNRKLKNR